MKHFYITGTGKGLGKALAEGLLSEDPSAMVTGISKTCSITHPRFRFCRLDLSDLNAVKNFAFEEHQDAEEVHLVNNAGILGDIAYAGEGISESFSHALNINLVAPAILSESFVKKYASCNFPRMILNISSGAGKNPVDGWSAYCSSKAGLDMLSRVMALEAANRETGIAIYSLSPGIIDTGMQEQIRRSDKQSFSRKEEFDAYFQEGKLTPSHLAANKLISILRGSYFPQSVVISASEIP